jgi:hypothetical protein
MVKTFLEYRMVKRGSRIERETTDYVADEQIGDNRIVLDAAFIVENIETNKRAMFFLDGNRANRRIS